MKYWTEYKGHFGNLQDKYDNNIYSFDIETSNYLILRGKQIPAYEYENLSKLDQEQCEKRSNMYIWMFSINEVVYYGRKWEEFIKFLDVLEYYIPDTKIVFVHNLSFEFEYLRSVFNFTNVMARKSHKVMKCELESYNIEFRCTLFMTNCKLAQLPSIFKLDVEKMVGDLDYNLIRHSETKLTEKELKYCENDCLVIYKYIISELETYGLIQKIPITSTGHVRKELQKKVLSDYNYRTKVKKAINIDPHIYNLLVEAFAGGYVHSSYVYTDEVLENIDSFDFTSSYPYALVTHKFPSTEFKPCRIKKREEMINQFAYLIVVKIRNLKSKFYNNFLSKSKCRKIKGGKYDNGRIIKAEEIEIVLTDVDFYLILDSYNIEEYEILECYYSKYNYLPKQFIEFVLDKYVIKTEYKGILEKEVEYMKEKNKFNSLYGMSVTNNIRDEVIYDNKKGWIERPLENEEIEYLLNEEKKKSFLSFAYGVWVTAFARNNLIRNIMKLDKYVVYADTDSIKLLPDYDKNIITQYNEFVKNKIKYVSEKLGIDIKRFEPCDKKGEKRTLGIFDEDAHYENFITQGAKKYCYTKWIKKEKIKDKEKYNILEEKDNKYLVLEITVAGVPKSGCKQIKKIDDFRDNLIFEHKYTGKNLLMYCENMEEFELEDYQGNKKIVKDKTGCCILPTSYKLGKALEYADLISDESSKRSVYNE